MKMYMSVFRIRFINNLQYRAVAFSSVLTNFVWGLMQILAFWAIYHTSTSNLPMEFSQTVSYIWMQQTLMVLFSVVFADGEIYSAIRDGSIAYELVRPMDLYGRWFCQSAANRIAFTMLNCLPVIFISFIMPKRYRMSLPLNIGQFLLFLLSTVLALCVVVAFAMLMYITLFYTLSHRGIKIIVTAVTTFLSGGVIPLPFFSESVLVIVQLLPFAAMQNMPLRIYSGNIVGVDALKGIAFQVFWFMALLIIGRFTMRRTLKKVIVQGG